MTTLTAIRRICGDKQTRRIIPALATTKEIAELSGQSMTQAGAEAAELVEAGFVKTGRTINDEFYIPIDL